MTAPVLTFQVQSLFRELIEGSGPIKVSKSGRVWTLTLDTTGLQVGVSDADVLYLGFDQSEGVWKVYNGVAILTPPVRVITQAGDVTVTATDGQILMNKTVPATTTINLPAASGGVPITVKDISGNAASFNITLDPAGAETIDGQSTFVMDSNFQALTIRPKPDGTGWYIT